MHSAASSFYSRQKENLAHKMSHFHNADTTEEEEEPTLAVIRRPEPRSASSHPKELTLTPGRFQRGGANSEVSHSRRTPMHHHAPTAAAAASMHHSFRTPKRHQNGETTQTSDSTTLLLPSSTHRNNNRQFSSPSYNIEQEGLINRMRERLKNVEQKETNLREFSTKLKERAQKVYAIEQSLKEKETKVSELRHEYEKMKLTLNEKQRRQMQQDRSLLEQQKKRFASLEQQRLDKLEE
eukprot:CAMPEP_0117454914 /NCGR_PEP_ID=MMETSP0759-20121206/11067_1 /TAXON_ID=63605 /ORGANISM="Percolomonas cosmopolitus, Strain WS" /LENGTH=237 /DNA_ID=CAMNT_0005248157 /DNA_START=51 /DNA_END=762 /DNA_ORIENTATION=-